MMAPRGCGTRPAGKALAILEGHADRVWSAAFSPDGTRVVTASDDRHRAAVGRGRGQGARDPGRPRRIGSGRRRSARTARGWSRPRMISTARLWDAASGKALATLEGHADRVRSAAFSPDGTRVVTASDDAPRGCGTRPRARRSPSWKATRTAVWSAAFSPDGTRVVTASDDQHRAAVGRGLGQGARHPGGPQVRSTRRRSARTARGWSRRPTITPRGSGGCFARRRS